MLQGPAEYLGCFLEETVGTYVSGDVILSTWAGTELESVMTVYCNLLLVDCSGIRLSFERDLVKSRQTYNLVHYPL